MIPAIQAYSRAAGLKPATTVRPDKVATNKFTVEIEKTAAPQASKAALTPQNVISPAEREFFIGLYPESAAQIARHVVFNRAGRLSVGGAEKGSLFDGRG